MATRIDLQNPAGFADLPSEEAFRQWVEAADDTWTHGSWRTPSLLFDDVQFSGA